MLKASFEAYRRVGLETQYQLLTAEQALERVRVTKVCGALFASENASMHPARLVRGIARAIERRGGTIYEKTQVTGFLGDSLPLLPARCGPTARWCWLVSLTSPDFPNFIA